jgi:hypothetical protein
MCLAEYLEIKMGEVGLQWLNGLKLALCLGFGMLYGFGGMRGKWKRRYVGPCVYFAGLTVFSLYQGTWNYLYVLYLAALIGTLTMGYGESSGLRKFYLRKFNSDGFAIALTRLTVGLSAGLAAAPLAIINGQYALWILHIAFCASISSVLGTINPIEAREEETIIGVVYTLLPIFMV